MFAKKAKWKTKGALYREWLQHKLLEDLPEYASDKWKAFDADDVLMPLGLQKRTTATAGGAGAFFLGALVGGVVALMLAPKPGSELRTTVRDRAMNYINKNQVGTQQQASA